MVCEEWGCFLCPLILFALSLLEEPVKKLVEQQCKGRASIVRRNKRKVGDNGERQEFASSYLNRHHI